MRSLLLAIGSAIVLTTQLLASSGPGTSFCHPTFDAAPCPCANNGPLGNGCGNSVFTGGAILSATGIAAPIGSDTVQFTVSNVPPGTGTVYFQGDAATTGLAFGDGVRCVAGTLTRLGVKLDNGGVQNQGFNDAAVDSTTTIGVASGDAPISVLGAVPSSGGTFFYQCYYRNPAASWCPPFTFNISQGYFIIW